MLSISIITVAYNSAETIGDTLESVRQQTYPCVEHIVVDGASTDGTPDIARTFEHVARVVSEPDCGAYDAMNKGIALASGDVIGLLNADDAYVSPEALAWVAQTLQQTGADACYADLQYVRRDQPDRIVRHWHSGPFRPARFRWGWMPPHPTFFTYKKYYNALGAYDTRLRLSADYELMLRFLYKYRLTAAYLPRVLVRMRTGGMSNASLRQRWRANQEDRLAWQMNNLAPGPLTLWLKPLRKIPQFWPALMQWEVGSGK
ncbi:MAG: glycosyltransferase family 2 protein [Saprospiraceae bacterium]|nr:glycosyltransferase [Saprospiraceae bacterium]MDW8228809.1 glycosyltransferase family 2 protein [Saprospiraceae bacterium]